MFNCTQTAEVCSAWGYVDSEAAMFVLCRGAGYRACECQCGQHGPTIYALLGICARSHGGGGGGGGGRGRTPTGNSSSESVTSDPQDNSTHNYAHFPLSRTNRLQHLRNGDYNISLNVSSEASGDVILGGTRLSLDDTHSPYNEWRGLFYHRGHHRLPGSQHYVKTMEEPLSDTFPIPGSALAALTFILIIITLVLILWFYRKPPGPSANATFSCT